jgi:hypothetical protein
MQLALELHQRGWRAQARVRDSSRMLMRSILEARPQAALETLTATHTMLARAGDIVGGRRPCLVPTNRRDLLGPFDVVSKMVLSGFVENENDAQTHVLRPSYLERGGDAGYLKLAQVVPYFARGEGAMRTNVADCIKVVVEILTKARDKPLPHLGVEGELIKQISFVTPPQSRQSGGNQQKAKRPRLQAFAYDVKFHAHRVSSSLRTMSLDEFSNPYFKGVSSGCEFFRGCMKFRRTR